MESHHLLIQPFLDFLKFEKRYSRHTVLAYQNDLVSFFDFVVTDFGGMDLPQINHTVVRSWLASLKNNEDLTAKTLNRKISTLKSFFKYQIKTGVIQQTPMAKVVAPKNEKRLPNFVADDDIKSLFEKTEFPDSWEGHTDRLLLMIFYQTGMRLSEAIGLKESGIDFSVHAIKVLGKGNKERIIPMSPELKVEIKTYIQKKRTKITDVRETLLVTEKGQPLSPRAVYASVNQYLAGVTSIEKKSPHVLRHTFATHLMNNGANLNAVKELLGHSSLAATQVYTHNSIEKLKNIYRKAHPKA